MRVLLLDDQLWVWNSHIEDWTERWPNIEFFKASTVENAMNVDLDTIDLLLLDHRLGGGETGETALAKLRAAGFKGAVRRISAFDEGNYAESEPWIGKMLSITKLAEVIWQVRGGCLHRCYGVYPDGSFKRNAVADEHLAAHIDYNKVTRFGRAIVVDGEVIYPGSCDKATLEDFLTKAKEMDKEWHPVVPSVPYQ